MLNSNDVCWYSLLWITYLYRSDGQILVFARNLNSLEGRISVIVPSDATVHDLITAICDESGISQDAIPAITLNHAGTDLSPPDALADVGVGPETEVAFYVRRHQCTVMLDYIADNIYDSSTFPVTENISIPVGYGDILHDIRQQVYQCVITRNPNDEILLCPDLIGSRCLTATLPIKQFRLFRRYYLWSLYILMSMNPFSGFMIITK